MSILCAEKWDMGPIREMTPLPITGIAPIASALVTIESDSEEPELKTIPTTRNVIIIDPKEYEITRSIINQVLWIPEAHDLIIIDEDDCDKYFSPENHINHALLAVQHGCVAGVLLGTVEGNAFNVDILGVKKELRRFGVGQQLMKAAVQKAKDFALKRLTLYYFNGSSRNGVVQAGTDRRGAFFQTLGRRLNISQAPTDWEDDPEESGVFSRKAHMTYYLNEPDHECYSEYS